MYSEAVLPKDLNAFIDNYSRDRYALILIMFFAVFPNTRFNIHAVSRSLGYKTPKKPLLEAMGKLVNDRVMEVSMVGEVPTFRLGDDKSLRKHVTALRKLDYKQKRDLLRGRRRS